MNDNESRKYLENIVQGNVVEGRKNITTTIRNYLCQSYTASKVVERKFEYFQQLKKEQTAIITELSSTNKWWFISIENYTYLTEGGEAKIYLSKENNSILKLNDSVYYNTWLDFLNSILLHNFFFPNTAYNLIGFTKTENVLYAVLKQAYIRANTITNLENIKKHLAENGFNYKKRFDYYNSIYGITIEDLHDENVLTFNDTLFFIDTFFGLT